MPKTKQNLNLKIQMLVGKGTKAFFERFYKNLTSLEQNIKYIFLLLSKTSGAGKEENANPCKKRGFGPILAKLKCKLSI